MELKPTEFKLEFVINGITYGSGTIFVNYGNVDTSNVEDEFYATLRKNEKGFVKYSEGEQKSDIVDALTSKQEEILKEEHAKDYHGTDDDMPDAYEGWLEDLSVSELAKLI